MRKNCGDRPFIPIRHVSSRELNAATPVHPSLHIAPVLGVRVGAMRRHPLVPAGRTCAAPADGRVEVLQQCVRHRRLRGVGRRAVEHGQWRHRHESARGADDGGTGGRRRAGGVSLLAGRDLGRSRCGRHSRGGDVQRGAAAHAARLGPSADHCRSGRDRCVPAQWRQHQQGVYVPRRRPAVPRRGCSERKAYRQQAGWLSGLVAERRHHQNAGRQPGR